MLAQTSTFLGQRAFVSVKPSRASRVSVAKMATAALSQDELKKQVGGEPHPRRCRSPDRYRSLAAFAPPYPPPPGRLEGR